MDDTNTTPAPGSWKLTHPDYTIKHRYVFKHGRGATCTRKAWVVELTAAEFSEGMGAGKPYQQPCPACGRGREGTRITGRFKADVKCTAKCVAATGHDCDCSCAGKNHGAGHAA